MPRHSLLALIGFAESAVAAIASYRDRITAKNRFPELQSPHFADEGHGHLFSDFNHCMIIS